jgi:ankyrin repeat protein
VNANIKTETLEDLRQKKKNMHLKAFQVLIDDAQRLKVCEEFRPVLDEMVAIKGLHGDRDVADYLDDSKYSDLVSEMLEVHLWSIEQLKRQSGKPLMFRERKKACSSSVELGLQRQDSKFLKSKFDAHKDILRGIDGPSLIAAFRESNARYIPDDIDIQRLICCVGTTLSECTAQKFEELLAVSCESFFCKVSYESRYWRVVTRNKDGLKLLNDRSSHMHQSVYAAKVSPVVCHICNGVCRVEEVQFSIPKDQFFDLIPWEDATQAPSFNVPKELTSSGIFKKHCIGYISKENIKAAFADIQAPIFYSECCDDHLSNDALTKSKNCADFETFSNLAITADELEEFLHSRKVSLMADAFRPFLRDGLQLSQAHTLHECILRLATNVTSQSLLRRVQKALIQNDGQEKQHKMKSKCMIAVSNAFKRCDVSFLRRVFDHHSLKEDSKGGLSVATLALALVDADAPVVPDSEADAAAAISRFDANCNGLMDFGEFVRAVNAPDELALYFQEKRMPALADALRTLVGRGSDQLLRVSQLSAEEMQAAASSVCSHIPHEAKSIQEQLQRSFAAQFELLTQSQADGGSKFTINKMSCGCIEDFYAGLSNRVGMPHLDFKREMMREHCQRAGCDTEFTTGLYKITTTPKNEWLYVAGDENGQRVPCPAEFMTHNRRIPALDELKNVLRQPGLAKLCDEEILALILFSGPMYQLYNMILRRFPGKQFELFKEGGNTFATTIFVLVSAITKIARCTRIPEGTLLYRSLGGLIDLPDHFVHADENGVSGFMDWGFISMTTDRDVALGYSGMKQRRPKAIVMVVEVSSVDRGADISLFSQYPGEKEFLWPPCCFVQRTQQGGRVEVVDGGVVMFVPVKVNLNLKTETVEELREKKKRLHLMSARAMVEEVRYELGEWAKSAEAAARLQKDKSRNQRGTLTATTLAVTIVKQYEDVVMRHSALAMVEYIDDGAFRALMSEIMDTKAWAKEKMQLWMMDERLLICFLQDWSLRECHRLWQSYLQQCINRISVGSHERAHASLQLLIARGLGNGLGYLNADGENVMVQAGGDGWSAKDIRAAAAAGADVGASDGSGHTCVWNAARYGHKESITALLEVKGDVNKCDNHGASPIHAAAQNGHAGCLQYLLAAGGDVNKCDNHGASSIYLAADMGHADCLELLLAAGGDVNKCDNHGASPIHAAAQNGHAGCLQYLLSAGGDVNKCDNHGASPIHSAAQNGHAGCLQYLLSAGGDVNKCDNHGASPIHSAAQNGHAGCLQYLLAAGGDVNKCDNHGASPIHSAAQNGHAGCLQYLLAAGGDVNKCDNHGASSIYLAADMGHADCLELLLAAGGDPRINCKGISALDFARQKGHGECVLVLEAALV